MRIPKKASSNYMRKIDQQQYIEEEREIQHTHKCPNIGKRHQISVQL
jgi:hypothetical protein